MKSTFLAPLLVAGVSALPELHISKRDAHGQTSRVARGVVRRDAGYVTTNVFDIAAYSTGGAYYANLTVGTPPQNQIVILDTGSSDLYFDASTASTCQTTGEFSCRGGTFDRKGSSTYHEVQAAPAFNTSFGDGSTANGPYAEDFVGIGDVVIGGVQFGLADYVNSTTGYSLGLMGLGYSAIEAVSSVDSDYPNMPEVLVDAGVIASRLYSVYLNDVGEVSGTILFGGIDTSKYTGDLATLNCLPTVYVQGDEADNTGIIEQFVTTVTGLSITAGSRTDTVFENGVDGIDAYSDDNTLTVLLDTGSSAWSVPEGVYNQMSSYFSFVDQYGTCACSHQNDDITLTLQFGNAVEITVPAREFIVPLYDATTGEPVPYEETSEDTCAFMIDPVTADGGTGQIFLTLGDAILRSMYVVFDLDNGQVSIAQAAVNSTSSPSIVTVGAGVNGIASALSQSYSSATVAQTWSIAAAVIPTGSFSVSTAQTTLGEATGTAAEPADAVATNASSDSGSGSNSAGSGSNSGSQTSGSGSGKPTSSTGAATALSMPGMDWAPVWSMSVALCMGVLGMAVML